MMRRQNSSDSSFVLSDLSDSSNLSLELEEEELEDAVQTVQEDPTVAAGRSNVIGDEGDKGDEMLSPDLMMQLQSGWYVGEVDIKECSGGCAYVDKILKTSGIKLL